MAFLLDSSRKQKQNICDASLFKVKIESDPEFLGVTISHCHSLPALWQIVLSILKRVMFDQKKKNFQSFFFFFFELVKGMISEDKPNRFFLPPLCSILCGFFHQFFFFADLECTFSGVQYSCVIVTRMFVKHNHDL